MTTVEDRRVDERDESRVPDPTVSVRRVPWAEVVGALATFGVLCAVVLAKAPQLLEPDDFAYRASIVALSHGELLLSNAQFKALETALSHLSPSGLAQWHHLKSGDWISEKNPGYPFLAVAFYVLGVLRLAPLFYGALGCVGLFYGARRWLGPWAGTYAVGLFCTSGAAMAFAWRSTMPSFTDASLIAGGLGLLLWAAVADEASTRRRTLVGALGSLCLMAATFVRYTDVAVALAVALGLIALARPARLRGRMVATWLGVMLVSGLGIMAFNEVVYGGATSTGYSAGEITFSLSAVPSNLVHMPIDLVYAMPLSLLGVLGVVGIAWRAGRSRRDVVARRDLAVGAVLLLAWAAIWGLYLAYPWTVGMAGQLRGVIHVVRFYVPALGAISLLGAWALARLSRSGALGALVVLAVIGVATFPGLASGGGPGPGGPGRGPLSGPVGPSRSPVGQPGKLPSLPPSGVSGGLPFGPPGSGPPSEG